MSALEPLEPSERMSYLFDHEFDDVWYEKVWEERREGEEETDGHQSSGGGRRWTPIHRNRGQRRRTQSWTLTSLLTHFDGQNNSNHRLNINTVSHLIVSSMSVGVGVSHWVSGLQPWLLATTSECGLNSVDNFCLVAVSHLCCALTHCSLSLPNV